MKKLSLALLSLSMMAGSLSAHADLTDHSTTTKPDIIRTTIGDLDAHGVLLNSNKSALQRMDFDTVKTQAEKGDKNAQFFLAKMYHMGVHTKEDTEQAQAWYQKAADNGNPFAMNNLAIMLSDGPTKKEQAVALFKKSAEQNIPHAMVHLAREHFLAYGEDPTNLKNYEDGIALLTKAGEMGHAPAYLSLYRFYGLNQDTTDNPDDNDKETQAIQDKIQAQRFEYLTKSAEMGYAYAQLELSDYYQMNGVMSFDKSVRPLGIAKTYEWAKRACANGIERGCQTARYFGGFASAELAVYEAKCIEEKKSTKKTKADGDACETYEALKDVRSAINTPK